MQENGELEEPCVCLPTIRSSQKAPFEAVAKRGLFFGFRGKAGGPWSGEACVVLVG